MKFRRIAAVTALFLAVSVLGAGPARADLDSIRQAAVAGNAQAQYHLGILYEFGFHLADHDVEEVVWYSLAADQGNKDAAKRRDLLAARLTAAQKDQVAHEIAALKAQMSSAPPTPAPVSAPQPESSGASAPSAPTAPADGGAPDNASGTTTAPSPASPAKP